MSIGVYLTEDDFVRIHKSVVHSDISWSSKTILVYLIFEKTRKKKPSLKSVKSDLFFLSDEIFNMSIKELESRGFATVEKKKIFVFDSAISLESQKDLQLDMLGKADDKPKQDKCPYGEIYAIIRKHFPDWKYNENAKSRAIKIRKIWKSHAFRVSVFDDIFRRAKSSDFLMSRNGHQFKGSMNISWIINNTEKILEGRYDNENMEWAIGKKDLEQCFVVGEGLVDADPKELIEIGVDEITGAKKYVRK